MKIYASLLIQACNLNHLIMFWFNLADWTSIEDTFAIALITYHHFTIKSHEDQMNHRSWSSFRPDRHYWFISSGWKGDCYTLQWRKRWSMPNIALVAVARPHSTFCCKQCLFDPSFGNYLVLQFNGHVLVCCACPECKATPCASRISVLQCTQPIRYRRQKLKTVLCLALVSGVCECSDFNSFWFFNKSLKFH